MLSNEEIARLLDIANAGCHKGLVAQARRIYEAVLADRPGHVPALIGKAYSHLVVDQFAEAEEILKGILAANPADEDARAYLGLTCFVAGRKEEAKQVLEPLAEAGSAAGRMARSLIEQA